MSKEKNETKKKKLKKGRNSGCPTSVGDWNAVEVSLERMNGTCERSCCCWFPMIRAIGPGQPNSGLSTEKRVRHCYRCLCFPPRRRSSFICISDLFHRDFSAKFSKIAQLLHLKNYKKMVNFKRAGHFVTSTELRCARWRIF